MVMAMDAKTAASHVERINRDGYTIVEDAIEPDLVDGLLDDLDRLVVDLDVKPAQNDFEGASTLRVYNLLVHGERFERVPVHPSILPIVDGVLGPGCLVSSL